MGRRRVLVRFFAMLVGSGGVLLGFLVVALIVLVGCLVVMMLGGGMVGRRM